MVNGGALKRRGSIAVFNCKQRHSVFEDSCKGARVRGQGRVRGRVELRVRG